jgi:hypothetical protein
MEITVSLVRAFISGLIIPSIFIPFALTLLTFLGHKEVVDILIIHWIPIAWGLWNVFYFNGFQNSLPNNEWVRLFLTGAILGLIIAFIGVYVIGLPAIVGIPIYIPLVGMPLIYGIIWMTLVRSLNHALDVK